MSTKITFWREGFATNSSSSHSLIFSGNASEIETDDTREFGWAHFTAADKTSKLNYMMLSLYSSWIQLTNISVYNTIVRRQPLLDFLTKEFKEWVKDNVPCLTEVVDGFSESYGWGLVDHQSMMGFPCHRKRRTKFLNGEFAEAFIKELTENDYIILGGNDNSEEIHPLKSLDEYNLNQLGPIYQALNGSMPKNVMCELDHKTGEWVCSDMTRGRLFKFVIS